MFKKCCLAIFVMLLLLPMGFKATAGEPMDVLRAPMDEALTLLRDPQYKADDPSKKLEQREPALSNLAQVRPYCR